MSVDSPKGYRNGQSPVRQLIDDDRRLALRWFWIVYEIGITLIVATAHPIMTLIAGLASNRGRNLLNIADRRPGGAELGVVLTNQSDAPVLDSAAERGIPTEVVEQSDGMSRREHERAILEALAGYNYELVCLDGYMRILSDTFLDEQPTTFNVHPSLLPSFPGMDAWGDALSAGVSVSGCTVHVVTDATDDDGEVVPDEIDSGPIVTQEPVVVRPEDSKADLKHRILYEGEFRAYPRAVEWFLTDRIRFDPGTETVTRLDESSDMFEDHRIVSNDRFNVLRYGENPHQSAAVYRDFSSTEASVVHARQHNPEAKAMSYNNYNDADAALSLIKEFDEPAAAVIKHTNPAGCATADSLHDAYENALSTDPMSAFGGIVALNRKCDEETATAVTESFKEVIVAPAYTEDALAVLREKDNLRILAVGEIGDERERFTESHLVGGRLVQERDSSSITIESLETVTEREPSSDQLETMAFAWKTLKHVKSNAILFADGTETVGIGMGQVSRIDAVRLAALKADEHAEGKDADGAVMASDAFFPFRDNIDEAMTAGIDAVIQPGGSVNDEEVIEAANEHDMAMVFTGTRCFRHD